MHPHLLPARSVRRSFRWLIVSAITWVAANAQPVPVPDLFRTAPYHYVSLSPDGRYLVTLFPHSQERNEVALGMLATNLDTGETRTLHHDRGISVLRAQWVGDARLFTSLLGGQVSAADPAVRYLTAAGNTPMLDLWIRSVLSGVGLWAANPDFLRYGLYAVNVDGTELKEFARPGRSEESLMAFSELVATHTGTPDEVLVMRAKVADHLEKQGWRYGGKANWPGVYRLNVRTGESSLVVRDPGRTREWFVDPSGRVRGSWGFERDLFDGEGRLIEGMKLPEHVFQWIDDEGNASELPGVAVAWAEAFNPLGFERGGKRFLFSGRQGRDRAAVWAWNPAERRVEGPLLEHEQFDLREAIHSPHDGTVAGIIVPEAMPRVEWFDPELRQLQASIDAALPDRFNAPLHWSRDYRRVLLHSSGPEEPGAYLLLDRPARSLSEILRPATWLAQAEFGRTVPVRLQARDGAWLHGYLTRPPNAPAGRPLPTVLYVGGGPWGRQLAAKFDPAVQFFATRGFAVLQVNHRGSAGFGRRFLETARGAFDEMPNDLIDAVEWATAQGHAMRGQWVAAGEGYGGYAAAHLLAARPEQFRAGVALSPLADVGQVMKDLRTFRSRAVGERAVSWWKEWVGDPEKDRERIEGLAVAAPARQIKAPVFVGMASINADRVEQRQSATFAGSLGSRGVKIVKFTAREVRDRTPRDEYLAQTFTALEKFLREHARGE